MDLKLGYFQAFARPGVVFSWSVKAAPLSAQGTGVLNSFSVAGAPQRLPARTSFRAISIILFRAGILA